MGSFYLVVKRVVDIALSIIMVLILIIFLPLLIIVAISIKLDSKGPIFFKQKRSGYKGKPFMLYKFRTYPMDHDCFYCVGEKENLTKVGKILRKLSIDELPQIINIVKGDMSFVGPRPWVVENMQYYTEEQKKRLDVLPGLTGYAQINGRKHLDMITRIEYDLYYVENISLWLDLKIIFKTIGLIFINSEHNRLEGNTPKTEIEELQENYQKVTGIKSEEQK